MSIKYVNQGTLEELQRCDKVIHWMKETLLVHGPANQIGWIRGVKQLRGDKVQHIPNDPRPRVILVQEMYNEEAQKRLRKGKDYFCPLFMYAAARTYGAANCQEYAAVVYVYFREVLGKTMFVIVVVNAEQKHCFTLISKQPAAKSPDAAGCIVVDPWPTRAQAVLLEDHFCWDPDKGWSGLGVLRSKPGTEGKSRDLRRKARAWAEAKVRWDPKLVDKKVLEYQKRCAQWGPPEFYVEYCSRDKSIIDYRV